MIPKLASYLYKLSGSLADSHCLTLDYDAKSKASFDSTMTLPFTIILNCSLADSHCLTLDYDAKSKASFDSTMTLKPVPCNGAKKFLCERKGINLYIDGEFIHWFIIYT